MPFRPVEVSPKRRKHTCGEGSLPKAAKTHMRRGTPQRHAPVARHEAAPAAAAAPRAAPCHGRPAPGASRPVSGCGRARRRPRFRRWTPTPRPAGSCGGTCWAAATAPQPWGCWTGGLGVGAGAGARVGREWRGARCAVCGIAGSLWKPPQVAPLPPLSINPPSSTPALQGNPHPSPGPPARPPTSCRRTQRSGAAACGSPRRSATRSSRAGSGCAGGWRRWGGGPRRAQ
jgi:hypothetical protein